MVTNALPRSDHDLKQCKDFLQKKGWRDAVVFGLGSIVAVSVLFASGASSPHAGVPARDGGSSWEEPDGLEGFNPCGMASMESPEPGPRESSRPAGNVSNASKILSVLDPPGPDNWHISSTQVSPYAYVMMAYDPPGAPVQYIWQAIAVARALLRLSQYPVILLTNTTHLPEGTSLAETFWKLNVQVFPLQKVPVPPSVQDKLVPVWRVAFWKLQIWRMTQYEKLIWLDTDSVVFHSIDYIFNRKPIWGQRDAWVCSNNDDVQNWLCSGLMLIEPSEETYQGLLEYAGRADTGWWDNGVQKLIHDYYEKVLGQPVQLLNITEAAFGKCLGVIPSLFHESIGTSWKIPAFVHRSSVKNECFYFVIADQLQEVKGTLVNICHYHPLGPYWRDIFCDGARMLGVKTDATEAFCDDVIWYRHR